MADSPSRKRLDASELQTPQPLRLASSGAVIVVHKEDTTALTRAFEMEGISVDQVQGPYTETQLAFTGVMQALVNHANAWRIAAGRDRPTIVVEPDFVPVKGFGDLPVPVPPDRIGNSLAYLYSTGPAFWDVVSTNVARGHSGGAVALLIPPNVAALLLQFYEEVLAENSLGNYSPWDARMGYWLKDRGIESYIPYRQYGEHGGIGNPEHAAVGLPRTPRADALQAKLAFLPIYAQGSALKYWKTRIWARIWGVLRLLFGRSLARHDLARSNRWQMLRFAVGRLFLRYPSRERMS